MAQKRKHFNNTDLKYETSDSKPQFTQRWRAWLPVSEHWKKMIYLHAEHAKKYQSLEPNYAKWESFLSCYTNS